MFNAGRECLQWRAGRCSMQCGICGHVSRTNRCGRWWWCVAACLGLPSHCVFILNWRSLLRKHQDLSPGDLVELIDFQHLSDVVTKKEALTILKEIESKKADRKAEMKKDGFPAYTTSAGWLGAIKNEKIQKFGSDCFLFVLTTCVIWHACAGYSPEKIKDLCKDLLEEGMAAHHCRPRSPSAFPATDWCKQNHCCYRVRALVQASGGGCCGPALQGTRSSK